MANLLILNESSGVGVVHAERSHASGPDIVLSAMPVNNVQGLTPPGLPSQCLLHGVTLYNPLNPEEAMRAIGQETRNVATLKKAHDAFNEHNFSEAVKASANDIIYNDRARNVTFNGPDEQITFMEGWADAFSDARIEDRTYSDAGDAVIVQFTGRGTNDGSVGPYAPSGKPMEMAFCEVVRFNDEGKVKSVDLYYDQMTMLIQLGHIEAPAIE